MWMKRLVVLNQVAVALGALTQLLIGRSEPPTRRRVAETLLGWSLALNLGVLETSFFVRHVPIESPLRKTIPQEIGFGRRWRSRTWCSACSVCCL